MLSKTSAAVVLATISSLVSAQTSTLCNPLKQSCPPDSAFGNNKISCDWTQGPCDAFHELDGTSLTYNGQGAVFTIVKESNAPTIMTSQYIFFGRVDVEVQAAAGAGIVTSAVLQSDDLDEIDLEWVGGDNAQVQSNYFSKGDTTTYDRGAFHPVANPLTSVHMYSIEWTAEAVQWIIDGAVVRTLTYGDAQGGATFPQTPMQVKLGTWVGGCSTCAPGTVEWAGGLTDFSQAPFNAYYKSITITDYAGGSAPPSSGIKQYVYGDNSGTWQSIDVIKGDGSSDDKPTKSASHTSAAPSTTSKAPKTTTHTTHTTHSTTSKETTTHTTKTKSKTTMTTAASSTASKTEAASTSKAPATSTSSAPPVETTGAAPRDSVAFGSVLLAGAGVLLAQML